MMNGRIIMIRIAKIALVISCGVFLLIISLQSISVEEAPFKGHLAEDSISPPQVSIKSSPDIENRPLQDNPNVYQYDNPGSVVTMYVTVRKGNPSDNSSYSWEEVEGFTKGLEISDPNAIVGKADAILQIGNENGPLPGELGYGLTVPNATIQIRGASSAMRTQKSFKIELFRDAGNWRGQSTIALNKNVHDISRVRPKLNFDLLKQIPNIISLRTQFVHLYIKDETIPPWETEFEDYGLFTQIELPNRRFLESHLLDPNGQLYKTVFFEFYRYPEQIRLVDDPLFEDDEFSTILEIKGNSDNSKLIQMLDDLNNPEVPIDITFNKYFDSDNFFTWLAYNILVGNIDTQSQNFYLYSPQNGAKFYFIPWDYDDSFFRKDREICCGYRPYAPFNYGVANYWGSVLPNRLLREPVYRQMLDIKVQELMKFLTPQTIAGLLEIYRPVTEKYVFKMPDSERFQTDEQGFAKDFLNIPTEVQNNYELYLESLKSPMPFFLGVPKVIEGRIDFIWGASYDFNGENIAYHFVVSKDPSLTSVLVEKTIINEVVIQIDRLSPGEYFWGVSATNSKGKSQLAFDAFREGDVRYYGVKRFIVTPDGEINE